MGRRKVRRKFDGLGRETDMEGTKEEEKKKGRVEERKWVRGEEIERERTKEGKRKYGEWGEGKTDRRKVRRTKIR